MQIFNSRSLLPLLIIMIGVACVKDPQDIPPGLTSDPVFGMVGQFGNQTIDLDAGVNQWTFVPVVNELDSLHVYTAVLSQDGCVNQCPNSWTFNFYQALSVAIDEEEKFKNTIQEGPVDFVLADTERDSFQVSISTHPDLFANGDSYWGDPSGEKIIYSNEYNQTVGSEDFFNACFQSVVYAGCQYNQCVYFKPSTLIPCIAHIEAELEEGRYLVLKAVAQGTPPFQVYWTDGPTSSTEVVALGNSTQDVYAAVTIIDANGNRSELAQTIRVQDIYVDACYYPINIVSTPFTDLSAELAAGDVEIIYIDGDGVEWKSTQGAQTSESSMLIHEVGYYGVAPSGLPAHKVDLSVKVLLTNVSTGESRWFESSNVVLPLSHPE
jgi:hypothetical protein